MSTWFLLIFFYVHPGINDDQFVEKVAIPMTGNMAQHCTKDKNGIVRYNKPVEGVDRHKVYTVCVTENHWRGTGK